MLIVKISELEECLTQRKDVEEIYNQQKSNLRLFTKENNPKCISLKQQRDSLKQRLISHIFVGKHHSDSHTADIPSERFTL